MTNPQQPSDWSDPNWQPAPPPLPPGQPLAGDPATLSGYGTPVYPAGYAGYGQPMVASRPTNGLAIAALVCSLAGIATCISAPVGAILGHIARKQIRERGEEGDGMALAGIIVGWIITALGVLACGAYVAIAAAAIGNSNNF